jgi:hypothetical protein
MTAEFARSVELPVTMPKVEDLHRLRKLDQKFRVTVEVVDPGRRP